MHWTSVKEIQLTATYSTLFNQTNPLNFNLFSADDIIIINDNNDSPSTSKLFDNTSTKCLYSPTSPNEPKDVLNPSSPSINYQTYSKPIINVSPTVSTSPTHLQLKTTPLTESLKTLAFSQPLSTPTQMS